MKAARMRLLIPKLLIALGIPLLPAGTVDAQGLPQITRQVDNSETVTLKGDVFLQSSDVPIALDELVAKLKAITEARGGLDERIYVRGDRKADYGTVMRVMARLSAAGFRRVALVTEVEQGQ